MSEEPTPIAGMCPAWCTDHLPGDGIFGHHRQIIAVVGEAAIEVEVEQLNNQSEPGVWIANAEGERLSAAEARQLAAALLDAVDIIDSDRDS